MLKFNIGEFFSYFIRIYSLFPFIQFENASLFCYRTEVFSTEFIGNSYLFFKPIAVKLVFEACVRNSII